MYFLPYLMGERSPHNDPSARAAFIGMSMDTDRADMLQAVFEGVASVSYTHLDVYKRQAQKCRGMDAEARRNRAMDGEFRRFRRA